LSPSIGTDVSEFFHLLSFRAQRLGRRSLGECGSEIEEPRGITQAYATGCLDFARHDECLPTDRNHFAIGLVIVSEIVFLRLSFDHVEKKLLELFIARARPQRSHDVKFQIAAKTWAQLPVARESQLVAVLAEMHVRHRTDETYALCASRDLIVSGWTIRSKLLLWNQAAVSRFD